jgi:hypothetical protein
VISYHVRFWDTRKISDTARGRYRVRWAVDGREHCKSFAAKALAAAFLVTLKDAARDGKPFDPATGLPVKPRPAGQPGVTWYEHARAYTEMKWPGLAATSRRSTAESLTTITLALTAPRRNAPDPGLLRQALFNYSFNAAATRQPAPAGISTALDWMSKASLPVAALEDPDTVRAVLNACARRLDGKPAAAATTRRKRAVFANALGYAVERRLLPASPLGQIQWKASEVAETVDRRSGRQPRPGPQTPESRPRARAARRAHGSVLRLPVQASSECTTVACSWAARPQQGADPEAREAAERSPAGRRADGLQPHHFGQSLVRYLLPAFNASKLGYGAVFFAVSALSVRSSRRGWLASHAIQSKSSRPEPVSGELEARQPGCGRESRSGSPFR